MTENSSNQPIKINVREVGDFTCPWCYIGRRHLEAAIKSFDKDASITVIWKPFLLNPDMPDEGIPLLKYMADKFGEDAAKRISRGKGPIVEPGKKVGISFTNNRLVVNTIKSQLLAEFALTNCGPEKQNEVVELLLNLYFEEGFDINSDEVLLNLAGLVKMDYERAVDYFTSDVNSEGLVNEVEAARRKGIKSVPYYEVSVQGFNCKKPYVISGAESEETFLNVFNELLKDYSYAHC